MGKPATLVVQVISDGSRAAGGLGQAETAVQKFESGLDRASVAAAGTLTAVGALAYQTFQAASEAQQQAGAVGAVYKEQAAGVQALADTAADRVGLAASEYNRFASVVGSQLQNMGFSTEAAAKQGDDLITMGADLAAQFGGSTSDAVSALSSLMRGERDPIERYAVSISQAAVDAKVAALGLDTNTEASKKNANAQATLALLTEQTASSQGAFAREADTAAGAQARASAQWENAKVALGEALLPIVADASAKFTDLATWVSNNAGTVQVLVGVLGGLAAGVLTVNAGLKAFRAVQTVVTAAQWLWNAAMTANPIGLVVLAVAGLVAGIVIAYNKFAWFRDMVGWVWDKLKALGHWIANNPVTKAIGGLFGVAADDPAAAAATSSAPGLYGGAVAATATPGGLFGAPSDPFGVGGGGGAVGAGVQVAGGDTYLITVSGLLDDQEAADKIEALLKRRGARKGETPTVRL